MPKHSVKWCCNAPWVEQHQVRLEVLHLVVAVPHLLAGDCLSHAGRLLCRVYTARRPAAASTTCSRERSICWTASLLGGGRSRWKAWPR